MPTLSFEKPAETVQENPLLIHKLLLETDPSENDRQKLCDGKTRETWGELFERSMMLASGLKNLGLHPGSKIAVVDYDTHNYLEAYYAIPSMQAVLHTVNIRFPPEQIAYTINHAEDKAVLVRDEFLPLFAKAWSSLKNVNHVLVMSESGTLPESSPKGAIFVEDLIKNSDRNFRPEEFDENTPATLFYTSGTAGAPKGVRFTHRQLVLHTLSATTALSSSQSPVRLESRDVILPLVPMFHVHGWGFPYVSGMLGQKYVLVGKYRSGENSQSIIFGKSDLVSHGPGNLEHGAKSPLARSAPRLTTALESGDRRIGSPIPTCAESHELRHQDNGWLRDE